jgi:hypothetical protein
MDERLPDGSSVDELLRRVQDRNVISGAGGQGVPLGQVPPPPDTQQRAAESQLLNQGFKGAMTRPRRAEPRDYVADDTAYLRGVTNQPRTWRDKLVDLADVVNTVAGGKPRVLPSKRERAIQQAEGQLARDFEVQKQSLSQMVPVELDNGQTVMVPARQAGTLSSQQQKIKAQNDTLAERRTMNESRKHHWDAMDARDRKRMIVSLYNSGGLNDPEMLEYAADQLGLPGNLREKFVAGQMRDALDEEGNIIQVNRQTGEVSKAGSKSYEVTKEAGRERRAVASQQGANYRAGLRGTGRTAAPDRATARRAATLVGQIERARREMDAANASGNKERSEQARLMGEQAAAELNSLNAGYEAGPGEKGYPYYKKLEQQQSQSSGQYSGRRISKTNVAEYGRRHGMSPEQAADYLSKEGAVIY